MHIVIDYLEMFRYISLQALNIVQKIKAMSMMFEDRCYTGYLNALKAMYVEGVKDGKISTHAFLLIPDHTERSNSFSRAVKILGKCRLRALRPYHKYCIYYSMSKMLKIDQVHFQMLQTMYVHRWERTFTHFCW